MLSDNKHLWKRGIKIVLRPQSVQAPVRINPNPITYVLNDPSTPQLVKQVPVPAYPSNPAYTVAGYQGGGTEPSSETGQAANVMVTIVNSLDNVNRHSEKKIGRWSTARNLNVIPRAGRGFNAYYDRRTLSFFHEKDPGGTGREIYTADSADIVAHELGHAILDAYRPDLWNLAYMEGWAFHEAFGDLNAFLTTLQSDEIIHHILNETGGHMGSNNLASRIAEEFGRAIWTIEGDKSGRNPNWLRNLWNDFKYVDPSALPNEGRDDVICAEPHNFSRVISGAVYDIFVMIYGDNLAKKVEPMQAVKNARDAISRLLFKTIQHAPSQPNFFESIAKTMLWCDFSADKMYHDRMWDIFVKRNIIKPVTIMQVGFNLLEKPEVKPLTRLHVSNHMDRLGVSSLAHNPLMKLQVDVSGHTQESVEAAHHMLKFLHETDKVGTRYDTPFEICDGKLVRSHFTCGCGSSSANNANNPTQIEYYRPYKPQNHNGCGCGRKPDPAVVNRPTVKIGCFVRYQVKR
jgi:hypothetical protein